VNDDVNFKPVERLFPFALRASVVVSGRDGLLRNRKHLHFVLVTPDLSPTARESVLKNYAPVPVLEGFSMAEFEKHFGFHEAKVIGFLKSDISYSIRRELKARGFPNLRNDEPPQADTARVIPAEK
jgi:hypothetical protein